MHILLLLLKIIGITLLVILGIILFLLLLILFVPIRYQASGELKEKVPKLQAKISFLFPLFWITAGYQCVLYGKVKLLGFTIFDLVNPKKKKDKKEGKKKNRKKEENKTFVSEARQETSVDQIDSDERKSLEQNSFNGSIQYGSSGLSKQSEEILKNRIEELEGKKTLKEKMKEFWNFLLALPEKLSSFWKMLSNQTEEMIEKLNDSSNKLEKALDFIQSEETIAAFLIAKKTLLKLLKSIRPRKGKMNLHVGTGDPGSTGQICAIYGFLYPFVQNCVMIEPDFEQSIIEGDFELKGYITGFMLVRVAWIALFHRDLKCIRKMIRNRR